jgi:hypothetical protein
MKRLLSETRFERLWRAMVAGIVLSISSENVLAEIIAPSVETANEVTGVRILEPGKWGTVRTVVANRSHGESTPLILVQFPSDPFRQFGSLVWMPPWSKREVQTLVLAPSLPETATSIELATRLHAPDGTVRGSQASGQAPFTRGRFESAIIAAEENSDAQSLVAALRQAAGLKPTTFLLAPRSLPTSAVGYEAIDSVFLAGRELDLDPIRREALLGFLERGGRLWVMLDGAEQAWPRELFGDRWDVSIIDSVEVTNFVLSGPSGEATQEFDHGVTLVRVCAPSFEVTHAVNGNPAALCKSVGRGLLIVTSLGSRGWLDATGGPTLALGDLQSFVAPTEDSRLLTAADTQVFDRHIGREIGHEILGRSAVAFVLGITIFAVIVAAFWSSRAQRLELAAPASVLFALASGGVLIGLGRASQSQTASTCATDQLVLYSDQPGRAEVLSRTSVYLSPKDNAAKSAVRTSRSGVIVTDRTGSGAIEQMIWSNPDSFEIVGLDLRPGAASNLTSHFTARNVGAARATIGVDANGIRGTLDLGGATWRDPLVLVSVSGFEALKADRNGALRQSETGTLGAGALQSEEEIARQQVAREILRGVWFPAKPTILVWSDLVETGVQYPVTQKGSSLRAIPVVFDPPASGTEISIPAVLLTPEPLRGAIGGRKSGAVYDSLKRAWLGEMHQPMLVVMQYRAPAAFGRIDVQSARLTLDLRAPGCRFDVVVIRDGKFRIVGGGVNPSGHTVVDLKGNDAPEMDPDGRMLIGIDVHGDETLADGPGWSLQRMDLSVRGRTR